MELTFLSDRSESKGPIVVFFWVFFCCVLCIPSFSTLGFYAFEGGLGSLQFDGNRCVTTIIYKWNLSSQSFFFFFFEMPQTTLLHSMPVARSWLLLHPSVAHVALLLLPLLQVMSGTEPPPLPSSPLLSLLLRTEHGTL